MTKEVNGKKYDYWEGRITIGYDPGTGKQKMKSVSAKTQAKVRKLLQNVAVERDKGTYQDPMKITVAEWLDVWLAEYNTVVKPFTLACYTSLCNTHIKPALGAVKLQALTAPTVQKFYNSLSKDKHLSPKTVKNIHGALHKALQQSVNIKYISTNPTDACKLPRVEKKEITPFSDEEIRKFLEASKRHRFETLFKVTLFTGLREGEVLGLMWDCVDFEKGTILVDKQLHREKKQGGQYVFASLKNNKSRMLVPASAVMQMLRHLQNEQTVLRFKNSDIWERSGLVFTDELGHHLATHTVYKEFKKIATSIGRPDARFHDLRHSYAVSSIRAGDDVRTVQDNLGHATAAFTLDECGHAIDQMKLESAKRMGDFMGKFLA